MADANKIASYLRECYHAGTIKHPVVFDIADLIEWEFGIPLTSECDECGHDATSHCSDTVSSYCVGEWDDDARCLCESFKFAARQDPDTGNMHYRTEMTMYFDKNNVATNRPTPPELVKAWRTDDEALERMDPEEYQAARARNKCADELQASLDYYG